MFYLFFPLNFVVSLLDYTCGVASAESSGFYNLFLKISEREEGREGTNNVSLKSRSVVEAGVLVHWWR